MRKNGFGALIFCLTFSNDARFLEVEFLVTRVFSPFVPMEVAERAASVTEPQSRVRPSVVFLHLGGVCFSGFFRECLGKSFFLGGGSELLMLVKQHSFSNNLVCTRKRWHGKCLFAIRVKSCVQFCLRSADFFSEHEGLGLILNAHFCVMLRLLQNARVLVTLWWLDCIACNYCGEIPKRVADLCPFLLSSSSTADAC